jgi:hypothetical protein
MNDDDHLDELLVRFRDIEPAASVRAANRAAVRAALTVRVTGGWLHRSVVTPLPAALAMAVLLLVSLTLNAVLWRSRQASGVANMPRNVTSAASPARQSRLPATKRMPFSDQQFEYSETQRYLSGIGVVDRQASYAIKGLP